MEVHRYKVQRDGFGLFLGIAAEVTRLTNPPTGGASVSDRVWLDASEVKNLYYGNRLTLSECEVAWLRLGLGIVSEDIELVETSPCILISVQTLEILEVDYVEAALAPAIAGWAAEKFSLIPRPCRVSHDGTTGQFMFDWDG